MGIGVGVVNMRVASQAVRTTRSGDLGDLDDRVNLIDSGNGHNLTTWSISGILEHSHNSSILLHRVSYSATRYTVYIMEVIMNV